MSDQQITVVPPEYGPALPPPPPDPPYQATTNAAPAEDPIPAVRERRATRLLRRAPNVVDPPPEFDAPTAEVELEPPAPRNLDFTEGPA